MKAKPTSHLNQFPPPHLSIDLHPWNNFSKDQNHKSCSYTALRESDWYNTCRNSTHSGPNSLSLWRFILCLIVSFMICLLMSLISMMMNLRWCLESLIRLCMTRPLGLMGYATLVWNCSTPCFDSFSTRPT